MHRNTSMCHCWSPQPGFISAHQMFVICHSHSRHIWDTLCLLSGKTPAVRFQVRSHDVQTKPASVSSRAENIVLKVLTLVEVRLRLRVQGNTWIQCLPCNGFGCVDNSFQIMTESLHFIYVLLNVASRQHWCYIYLAWTAQNNIFESLDIISQFYICIYIYQGFFKNWFGTHQTQYWPSFKLFTISSYYLRLTWQLQPNSHLVDWYVITL